MSKSPTPTSSRPWQFAIDVGGTFTDCVGIAPDGRVLTFKTLSSGRTKGTIGRVFDQQIVEDPLRTRDPEGFWNGARLFVDGGPAAGILIEDFHAGGGRLRLSERLPALATASGTPYEIVTGDEAPVLGIRHLLGLRSGDSFPPCEVKLGTTRGTNALLERKGARVGLVTTRGFGDILLIGDQARPRLFDLVIRKPEPLFTAVAEIGERLSADGSVLIAPTLDDVRQQLESLRSQGIESLAVALLHSYRNPAHERLVARAAEGLGFREVVLSSAVSPTIKIVPRGESTVVDAYLNPILRLYVSRIAAQLGLHATSEEFENTAASPLQMVDQYRKFLESKGLRLKSERTAVLAMIEQLDAPFEVEGLVDALSRAPTAETISRSTIYETLNQLVEAGLIRIQSSSLHPDRFERVAAGAGARLDDLSGPAVSMQVMTSGGGLIAASEFTGRDSILSGPAGGVIGSSQTAARAGFPRSIGFDMGGTSTDVSRYDGRFELEYESRKAGVRIASPMLAIETVAAGGGSLCRFDGVKFTVGPASAGSDPGPACYGRGGPLTITDCNLAVGRLVEEQFPFRLDRDAVEHRLDEILADASEKTDRQLSREELASGFLEIANAHMARAIRRISVSRGYDPAEYALSVFGGAGAQHACSLAIQLGMTSVVIHPFAGALSAYGIACADVVRHAAATILRPLAEIGASELDQLFLELEREVAAGFSDGERSVEFERSLDLRYRGVESSLSIGQPANGDYADAYAIAHQREFGYRRPDRPIEAVAARVEGRQRQPAPPSPDLPTRWEPSGSAHRVFLGGAWVDVPAYRRSNGGTVATVIGPALLAESMTTIVVDPGFEASIVSTGPGKGSIVLRRLNGPRIERTTSEETPDPVQLEIFNNLFASIAEQMGETLRRTSVSTNVKERLDYSCAVFDSAGELVVNAPHIPVHLGAMAETVRNVLADNPDLGPGDVVLTNDPFRGGSHLPDLTVVTPVFDSAASTSGAKPLFVVASRAHHAEIGGIVPGSMPPFSRTLAEEGVLIRNFRIVRRGEFQEQAFRTLLGDPTANGAERDHVRPPTYPSRRPDDNVADLTAQVAANQTGVQLLRQLVDEQSLERVQRYMRFIREAAATKIRQALAAMPDGQFRRTDFLDDGSPIAVTITIAGNQATVDFEGTGPVLSSNLNANRAIVTAAVLYVFRTLIDEDIPLNGGVLEPVTIRIPECLLNPPAHDDPAECAAIVGGNVETSQRVVDVLLYALGTAACSQGTMNNLTFGDATFGYYETICGGSGATPRGAGADAVHTHMTNTRLTDVELLEQRYPVRVREFSIRRGSGGAGKHCGGAGVVRDIEFLRPMTVSILSQRRGENAPPGLSGGGNGAAGRNILVRRSGDRSDLGAAAQVSMQIGDRIIIATPGGGAWGSRDSESEQTL